MNKKTVLLALLILLLLGSVFAAGFEQASASAAMQKIRPELLQAMDANYRMPPVPGRAASSPIAEVVQVNRGKVKVLLELENEAGLEEIGKQVKALGGRVKGKFVAGKTVYAEVSLNRLEKLAENRAIKEIWPDFEVNAMEEPIEQVNAPSAWDLGLHGEGKKIAVLDTGIDSTHPALQGKVIASENFSDAESAEDVFGHGTHVAGIIAGSGEVQGVAPAAELLNGKVLNDSGSGSASSVMAGINWAIEQGADVINLSLGAPIAEDNTPLNQAVRDAIAQGVVVVIAAGNCGSQCPSSGCGGFTGVTMPGNTAEAITVGAVDSGNGIACFSSGGMIGSEIKPDVTAPGVAIVSSVPGGTEAKSGTSMATPFAAGAVALVLEQHPGFSAVEAKQFLEQTALDLGAQGEDIQYGFGLVDLSKIALDLNFSPDQNGWHPPDNNNGSDVNFAESEFTFSGPDTVNKKTMGEFSVWHLGASSQEVGAETVDSMDTIVEFSVLNEFGEVVDRRFEGPKEYSPNANIAFDYGWMPERTGNFTVRATVYQEGMTTSGIAPNDITASTAEKNVKATVPADMLQINSFNIPSQIEQGASTAFALNVENNGYLDESVVTEIRFLDETGNVFKILASDAGEIPAGGSNEILLNALLGDSESEEAEATASEVEGWWDSGWNYRKSILLKTPDFLAAEVTQDHVMLVDFNSAQAGFWSHVKSDGSDVRFVAEDGTMYKHYFQEFDSVTKRMLAWVKVTQTFSAAQDTGFWVYYGNGAAADAQDAAGTLPDYEAVYHADEGTGTVLNDKTGKGFTGTVSDQAIWTSANARLGGSAMDFAGQYSASQESLLDNALEGMAFSFWARYNAQQPESTFLFFKRNIEDAEEIYFYATTDGRVRVSTYADGSQKAFYSVKNDLSPGRYYYFTVSWDSTNGLCLYIDGVQDTCNAAATNVTGNGSTSDFFIGANPAGAYFEGEIDEFKVLKTGLSGKETKLLYASESGSLQEYGTEEATGQTPGDEPINLPPGDYNAIAIVFFEDRNVSVQAQVRVFFPAGCEAQNLSVPASVEAGGTMQGTVDFANSTELEAMPMFFGRILDGNETIGLIFFDGNSVPAQSTKQYTFEWAADAMPGQYSLEFEVQYNGNTDWIEQEFTIVDTTAPEVIAVDFEESLTQNQFNAVNAIASDTTGVETVTATVSAPGGQNHSLELAQTGFDCNSEWSKAFTETGEIGEYTLQAEACDAYGNCSSTAQKQFSVAAEPSECSGKNILLVAGDKGFVLDQNEFDWLEEFEQGMECAQLWKESIQGSLTQEFLQKFDLVMWSAGNSFGESVDANDSQLLIGYVANGGRLFLEGSDIASEHVSDGLMQEVAKAAWNSEPYTDSNDSTIEFSQSGFASGLSSTQFDLNKAPFFDTLAELQGEPLAYCENEPIMTYSQNIETGSKTVFSGMAVNALEEEPKEAFLNAVIEWLMQPPLNPNLVLWLDFEEKDTQGNPIDKSQYGQNCIAYHSPPEAAGKFGKGLRFKWFDYLDCGNDASLNITDEITIAMWVNTADWSGDRILLTKGHNPTSTVYYVWYPTRNWIEWSTKGISGTYPGGATWYIHYTPPESLQGEWHHVAFTYNADGGTNNKKIYLDGMPVVQGTGTGYLRNLPNEPLYIGRYAHNADISSHFNGTIDEVRVYGRALSQGEIEALAAG